MSVFLRLLFVLLAALNIAVGAWLLLGQAYPVQTRATEPGVPPLRLLSELPEPPEPPASAPLPAAAATPAPTVPATAPARQEPLRCYALGPFATPAELRSARRRLEPVAARLRTRQGQASQTTGWWVSLAPAASREAALETVRQLAAKGLSDYFVVNSGEQPNAISLGLFKDPANARKRRDQVIAAGFPARLTERSESVPEYWLDLGIASADTPDWRRLAGAGVTAHGAVCF